MVPHPTISGPALELPRVYLNGPKGLRSKPPLIQSLRCRGGPPEFPNSNFIFTARGSQGGARGTRASQGEPRGTRGNQGDPGGKQGPTSRLIGGRQSTTRLSHEPVPGPVCASPLPGLAHGPAWPDICQSTPGLEQRPQSPGRGCTSNRFRRLAVPQVYFVAVPNPPGRARKSQGRAAFSLHGSSLKGLKHP